MGVKLAKMEALQRPNFLLNADFRYGVINQKGQSSYFIAGYGINMWRSVNSNGKVIVNSGSITLTSGNQYSAQFMQPVYYNLLDKTVTIAVSVKNIVGTVLLNLLGTNKTLQKGLNIFTYKITQNVQFGSGFQYFYFTMGSGSNVEIEFIKLEEGDCFTGMPAWNETEELLKCQSKFISIRNTNDFITLDNVIATSTKNAKICINIPSFIFNRAPTIEIQNVFVVQTNDGSWRQVNRVTKINYAVNYLILELETVASANNLNINAEQYLLINNNGYLNIDAYDY